MKFYKTNNGAIISNNEVEGLVELTCNTTDAALEKHVPVYEVSEDKIVVAVGSVDHPMEAVHYIMWIAQIYNERVNICYLNPGDKPEAVFPYISGSEVYAYCNLHGLWKCSVK